MNLMSLGDGWRSGLADGVSTVVFFSGLFGAMYLIDVNEQARHLFALVGALVVPAFVAWGCAARFGCARDVSR